MAELRTHPASGPSPDLLDRPKARTAGRGRIALILVAVVVLALVMVFGLQWWTHGRFVQGTNDAYLRADQVNIAPKVSGYVEQVYVADNQAVRPDQPLVKIDPLPYDAALAAQTADVTARQAEVETAERQVTQQQAAVAQAKAQRQGAAANAAFAASEAERFRILSSQGVETQDRAAQALNQKTQADAALKADDAAALEAERQVDILRSRIDQARAQLQAAKAQVQTAQINAGDTILRSSVAGRVGDKTVRVGQFVQPGSRLMSVVPIDRIYLVANFKETQIGRMRPGQKAEVKLDAFPGRIVDARLESFAPGTGSEFALLPPENATGNFTKVVQRVPVRFRLEPPADMADRLLPGLSATVTVDTSQSAKGGG